ncbi:MAG: NADH-quinone oxidoreductase subunit NuoG, partial [Burkholderiales bacterium]
KEALGSGDVAAKLSNRITAPVAALARVSGEGLQRIGEVPIYSSDPIVRRSPPLQKTRDAAPPVAWITSVLYERLRMNPGDFLRVRQGGGEALVAVAIDDRLPPDCIRLAAARPETAELGGMFGTVSVEPVAAQQKVAV